MTKLETKYSALQKVLDAKKKEGEQAEGVSNGLKNQGDVTTTSPPLVTTVIPVSIRGGQHTLNTDLGP